ncbi:MAG: S8 family serine peptidase [Anaerolineae bacterium]|nr:S8 family serine peptidase [Anaerolineae bacterium]
MPPHSRAQNDPPTDYPTEVQYATAGVPSPIMLRFPGGVPPYTHSVTGSLHGRISTTSGTALVYTADADFLGTDHFIYTMFDAAGNTFTQRVEIRVVPPAAYTRDVFAAEPDSTPPATPRAPEQVPNEWIVRYDSRATTRVAVAALVNEIQGTTINDIPQLNATVVILPDEDAVNLLRARPEIARVEPNLLRTVALTPNDPQRFDQWGLNAIDVYDAWNMARGTGEVIAILDTGVKLTHADLAAHIIGGWDFVNDDADASPNPSASNASHGTHVHGTANAVTNNDRGVAGVAWDARSIHARIIGTIGASAYDIAAGVIWAADNGASVINMSLAGPGWVSLERDAMDYAAARGVILVAAAGNDNTSTPYYPASYDHVLSISATKFDNGRTSFSNKGNYIDLGAPGANILSTMFPTGYDRKNGTSMASPHVAGVAALVWSRGLATTREEVMEALQCSALDLDIAGWDFKFGWGLVQAEAAVRYNPATTASCLPDVAHDDLDQAHVITHSSYIHEVDTTQATHWEDDPRPCAGWGFRTVWYKYTVPTDAHLRMTTYASTYNTVLAVYTGTRGNLTQVTCNDDYDGTTSSVGFSVNAGDEYYFMIASKEYEEDRGTLRISMHLDYELPTGCHPSPTTNAIICSAE